MNPNQIVQALLLITQLSANLPALIAAVRSTLSTEDEAELKAQLEALRASNITAYDAALDALRAVK